MEECEGKKNSNGNEDTFLKNGGSLSVLIFNLHCKLDLACFIKECKDAAHETKVPVYMEWGAMANNIIEKNLAQKGSHIIIMQFMNAKAAEAFSLHKAWTSWMKKYFQYEDKYTAGSNDSGSPSKNCGNGNSLLQELVTYFNVPKIS
mmetsp:Transcript_5160/g.6836  ORF Transcript_5160/g.6836 Transcript_5160/m.6836 type:complete len:147 (-) Transcript_5160:145-585(-)